MSMPSVTIVCFACGHSFERSASSMQYQQYTTSPRCGRRIEVIGGKEVARATVKMDSEMRRLNLKMKSEMRKIDQQMRNLRSKLRRI